MKTIISILEFTFVGAILFEFLWPSILLCFVKCFWFIIHFIMPPALKGARGITVYAVYFAGVFIFVNFASRVLVANLTTRKNIYLRSRRMNATCMFYAILVVQYTVDMQGRI